MSSKKRGIKYLELEKHISCILFNIKIQKNTVLWDHIPKHKFEKALQNFHFLK